MKEVQINKSLDVQTVMDKIDPDRKNAKFYEDDKGRLFVRVNPMKTDEKAPAKEEKESILDKVKDVLDDGKLNKSYKKRKK